ncbi:MAG: hypothetical protein IJV91_05685 [Kiritimatiellae bacterium]|nr:hypothetical protein [Kiritimatiellia bacterium]
MDLMKSYINRGRFGEFVEGFLKAETDRRKEEDEKDEHWRYWIAYVHSYSDKSFEDWKKELTGRAQGEKKTGGDADLDDAGIDAIMKKVFPGGW